MLDVCFESAVWIRSQRKIGMTSKHRQYSTIATSGKPSLPGQLEQVRHITSLYSFFRKSLNAYFL